MTVNVASLFLQETSYSELIRKLNDSEIQLVRATNEISRLEDEREHARHQIQNNEARMFELQDLVKKRDSEIDGLKRQVNGEYNQVGKSLLQQ